MTLYGALRELWRRLSGRAWAEETAREFARDFPGKCLICSYHRYGVTHGHLRPGAPVEPHDCGEQAVICSECVQENPDFRE